MKKSSKKSAMTTREIYQLSHFKLQANADLSHLQKVWVLMPYGIMRGEVYEVRKSFIQRAFIRLENGKIITAKIDNKNDWIKERS